MTVVLLCVASVLVAAQVVYIVATIRHIREIKAARQAMALRLGEIERTTAAIRLVTHIQRAQRGR